MTLRPVKDDDRERLQRLHLALDASFEQLTYAQQIAIHGSALDRPPVEVQTIERLLTELNAVRTAVRDQLLQAMAAPRLPILSSTPQEAEKK